MSRRMLINALNPVELRVATTTGDQLEEFKIDVAERGLTRGNIYFGIIANIQPSLNAAFIDYGAERHGFLAIQDVVPDAYYKEAKPGQRPRIEDVLERGQPIVVQITREPEGQKGAALTTNLSLAGRYLVMMPFETTRGVSRKVSSDDDRRQLLDLVSKLDLPDEMGVIVRTNALGQTKTALTRDLNALLRLWKRIGTEARRSQKTKLLYSDQDIILQALRDYLDNSIEEVVVDEDSAFEKAQEYMAAFMPRSRTTLLRHESRTPIFAHFKIESQIEAIYDRRVNLPSGGSIVIDLTEALTAIDVNSGKSTGASSQEETAYHTNIEAAAEVARQLRLRDLGGLIVVDFIDMRNQRNQRKVEKQLRDEFKNDKARFTVGRISPNGLLEINRQRLQQALQLRTHRPCPTCAGTGRIASPELVALHLIRNIEARAAGGYMKGVKIGLHPELADFVQNERRGDLLRLEQEFDLKIEIAASPKLHRPEQDISWIARDRSEIKRLEQEDAERRIAAVQAAANAPVAAIGGFNEEDEEEETTDAAGGQTPGTEGTEGTVKKRRRRRRRRGSRPDGSETNEGVPSANGTTADDGEASLEEAPEEPSAARAPSRRSRVATAASRSEEPGVETDAEPTTEPGSVSVETAEGDDTRPRRRRRRRRGGRRRTGEESNGDGGAADGESGSADASNEPDGD